MGKPESKIQKEIMNYLESQNFLVIRNHTQGVRYTRGRGSNPNKGISDLTIIKNGKIAFIEVKTEKGKLEESQIDFIEKALKYGVPMLVASDVIHVSQFISQHFD